MAPTKQQLEKSQGAKVGLIILGMIVFIVGGSVTTEDPKIGIPIIIISLALIFNLLWLPYLY